jgi:hypothetical protein
MLAGCGRTFFSELPIEYESVSLIYGDYGELHSTAGVHYSLRNVGTQEIVTLMIAFDLYEQTPSGTTVAYPSPAEHRRHASVDSVIPAGMSQRFVTSLDDVMPEQRKLMISRFRVEQAVFSDGTSWNNLGGHVWRSADE